MQCPTCRSDNTRKFSVVFQEGLSESHSTSDIDVDEIGTSGTDTVSVTGSGSSRTKTTTQTALSKKCSPPEKRSPAKTLFGFVVAGAVLGALVGVGANLYYKNRDFDTDLFQWWTIAGTAILGTLGFLIAKTEAVYNRTRYPDLFAKWQRSWLCLKCGKSYEFAD